MKTCYIFGAAKGMPDSFSKNKEDIVIAADGGYNTLKELGIIPDIILGDFDSLGYVPEFEGEIIKHPIKKDDTDTMLAVKTGLNRGFERFVLYGCTGDRLDHTIANIQTLSYIVNNRATGFLCGDAFTVTNIKNGNIYFNSKAKGTVSVFAFSQTAKGVNEKGLLYSLDNAELKFDNPLGVSNEFVGKPSEISVGEGILTVIWTGNLEDLY